MRGSTGALWSGTVTTAGSVLWSKPGSPRQRRQRSHYLCCNPKETTANDRFAASKDSCNPCMQLSKLHTRVASLHFNCGYRCERLLRTILAIESSIAARYQIRQWFGFFRKEVRAKFRIDRPESFAASYTPVPARKVDTVVPSKLLSPVVVVREKNSAVQDWSSAATFTNIPRSCGCTSA
jgi:hypothetical protein